MTHQLQNLRNQAAKLRRLSQPYFFPTPKTTAGSSLDCW